MADTSLNPMQTGPGSMAELAKVDRLKGYGGEITPTLAKANARLMAGGGSVMDLESQNLLLGQATSGSGAAGPANGLVLNTYV